MLRLSQEGLIGVNGWTSHFYIFLALLLYLVIIDTKSKNNY